MHIQYYIQKTLFLLGKIFTIFFAKVIQMNKCPFKEILTTKSISAFICKAYKGGVTRLLPFIQIF